MEQLKECFKCGTIRLISEFYKHPQMTDGHLGKCKYCTIEDTKKRAAVLILDVEWHEKEKARHREKYYRLDYKEKHKPTTEQKRRAMDRYRKKYPEKEIVRLSSKRIGTKIKGNHNHHWSYREEHFADVIELTPKDHATIHRFIVYDQEQMMYRNHATNILLDTRERHLEHINRYIETS